MALGGGTWVNQTKILPGAYINFVSADNASIALSERGTCAFAMELNWGADRKVIEIAVDDIKSNCQKVFGYKYKDAEMLPIREIFRHANKLLVYRLNSGEKATCDLATAVCSGTRGNDIKIVITKNLDDTTKFDVSTYMGAARVDLQTVKTKDDILPNGYIEFKADAVLAETAGMSLTGGTNSDVTGENHQTALDALESYAFNALGCFSVDKDVVALYTEYQERMRDEVGKKFALIAYKTPADYIGTINVTTKVEDAPEQSLVYWTAGAQAGCAVNKSCTNMTYDGELNVVTNLTQDGLKEAINNGEFVFHKVGDEVHVLSDVNSFVSFTEKMNKDFSSNQVIRVLDQIGNDIAAIFNTKYLGKINNNAQGRISLWSDIVTIHNQLQDLGAIENFDSDLVVVDIGNDKKSVTVGETVDPVCAMEKLYMTVTVA